MGETSSSAAAKKMDPHLKKAHSFISREPSVANEMSALVRKAESFVDEENILSKVVVDQINELIRIGKKAVSVLSDAERKVIVWDLLAWLEKVNTAISDADDMLDECAYHLHYYRVGRLGDKESKNVVRNYCSSVSSYSMRSDMAKQFKTRNLRLTVLMEANRFSLWRPHKAANERSGAVQDMKGSSEIESQVADERSGAVQEMKGSAEIESQVADERSGAVQETKGSSEIESQVADERSGAVQETKGSSEIESQVADERSGAVQERKGSSEIESQFADERSGAVQETKGSSEIESQVADERSGAVQERKGSSEIESQFADERSGAVQETKGSSEIESQVADERSGAVQERKGSSEIESQVADERSGAVQEMKGSSEIELQLVKEKNNLQEVENNLQNLDKDLSFISLVGWVGTGKTALARHLYKSVGHFDERIWVQVPLNFEIDGIGNRMLTSLTGTRTEVSTGDLILRRLQERLKGKRYLLVLDDIWEENTTRLDRLINFLHSLGGSRGSKVVITTCIEDVASSFQSSPAHAMSLETSDYCWALFDKIVFAKDGVVKTEVLENIGKNIVKECRGNPLYVKLLGSLMYRMRDESQWLRIKENKRWEDWSYGIPKLCYDYMSSPPLKLCLQYCFIFPRGYLIQREELIQLWMAQGYLNPPGAQCYDALLRSSFLQVTEDDDFDRKSCKMHDLLRGLDFPTPARGYCKTVENRDIRDSLEAMHLSLISCKLEFSDALRDSFSKLRTLRLEGLKNTEGLGEMLTCAQGLRVLIVVDESVEELPSSVGMLKRLKYLDISRTKIVRLPDSISKLYNLQTLRLYDLHESPENLENLVSLTHFYIENFKDSRKMNVLPPKFRRLVNLSSAKAPFKAFLDNACKIDNLELGERPDRYSSVSIYRLENVTTPEEATKAKLSTMGRIESLKLHWNARRETSNDEDVLEALHPHPNVKNLAIENFKGSKFPSWMDSLQYLVKMELENCSWCEQLPPLGQLRFLRTLRIAGMDNVKSIGTEFYNFQTSDAESGYPGGSGGSFSAFPALRELTLYGMPSLEAWGGAEQLSNTPSVQAFQILERFEVEQCPMLICIPDLVLHCNGRFLRKLRIALCEKLAKLPKGLGKLESLVDLEMLGVPSLHEFSIGCSNNLKSLTIGCFSSISKDSGQLHLKGGSTEVKELPEQLRHLSTLTNLTIWGYSELEALPDWLANLKSLQILKLESCGKLASFPSAEKMQQLTSLEELSIYYCPLLEGRCTRGRRREWRKISRIPTVKVNHETIQKLPRSTKKL